MVSWDYLARFGGVCCSGCCLGCCGFGCDGLAGRVLTDCAFLMESRRMESRLCTSCSESLT